MSGFLTLNNIIEVRKNKKNIFSNTLCSFKISAVALNNEMEVIKPVKKKMCIKIISVTQCQNPTGSIAL